MKSFFLIFAFSAGVLLPIQIGMNAGVGKISGSAIWAAAISFFIGTIGLFVLFFLQRTPWPEMHQIKAIPVWMWAAGLLGAYYVTATIVSAPKIGAALLVSLVVAGQMLAALVLDHYGLIGFPEHSINFFRVLGALLVVMGVVMVRMN